MLKISVAARGGGNKGLLDMMIPGYKDRIWKSISPEYQRRIIDWQNKEFEKSIEKHKSFQGYFLKYKDIEAKFAPTQKFRKPAVDWRRQLARGTLHFGEFFEGKGKKCRICCPSPNFADGYLFIHQARVSDRRA